MKLIKSLLILTCISSGLAVAFSSSINSFFKLFFAFSVAQIIIYQLYVNIVKMYYENLNIQKLKEYSKQGVEVTCPCYRENKVYIPIRLDGINDYKCLECDKNVSVNVDVKTFLVTEPLDGDHVDVALAKAIEEIKAR